jgi:molybdenum cofactor cytidylyltransferase
VATPPEKPARVACVILAAGLSSRLGRPKQLLDICGEPLVRRMARIALASHLDTVTVVIGNAAEMIRPLLDDVDVVIAVNSDFASGQASSIKVGVRAIPEDSDAVLFLLVDQPTMEPAMINAIGDTFRGSRVGIVQARYAGNVPGHPVLFSRRMVPDLLTITGDDGARSIVHAHRNEVTYVDFNQPPPPDIDTEDDYQRVLKILYPLKEHDPKT